MEEAIEFYTHPSSRGRIGRWMLEETGAAYRTEYLEYGAPMQAPGYLAINPMGKVPAIRHRGRVVTECAAICAYLADAFPHAGLAPPPEDRAAYYRWLFFAAGPLEAAITNKALGVVVPEARRGMVGYGSFERVLDTLETAVSTAAHVAGERFSAADVYVGSQVGWGLQFGTIEKRPAFVDYWSRICDRPALARANRIDDAAAAAAVAAKPAA
ncbi:MAG: glutathione S-transferase family protein [Lautropia sp.]